MENKYEEQLLSIFLRQKEAHKYLDKISAEDFTKEEYKTIYSCIILCFDKYGTLLTTDNFVSFLKDSLNITDEKKVESLKTVHIYLSTYVVDFAQITFLVDKCKQYGRKAKFFRLTQDALDLYEKDQIDAVEKHIVNGVLSLFKPDGMQKDRIEIVENFTRRKELLEEKKLNPELAKGVFTGIRDLDSITHGLWKGELGLIQGETNVGKSMLSLHFARNAFLNKKKVLYIVEEMPTAQLAMRLDAAFSHVESNKFRFAHILPGEQGRWETRFQKDLKELYNEGARLHITHIPIGCSIEAINGEIEYLKASRGEEIDLLIIDDLDMMEFPKKMNDEQGQASNARGLKGIAGARGIPVWFITQLATAGYGKKTHSIKDTGWSKRKIHVSDIAISLIRTPEDRETGRATLQIVKSREGDVDIKIALAPDLAKGIIHSESTVPLFVKKELGEKGEE